MPDLGQMMREASLGELIESVGVSISRAQFAMDTVSIELLERLTKTSLKVPDKNGTMTSKTLLELGFLPSFYHINEVLLDAKISLSTTQSGELTASSKMSLGTPLTLVAASVDAAYSNKFSFSGEASSSIKAKFVALPPPSQLRDALEKARIPSSQP